MNIKEKLMLSTDGLEQFGPINIVAFGDSITHGVMNGYNDYENVYWNRLRKKLNAFRNFMPVNIIDAGIGGTTATASLKRMESQVFRHAPDLVIICFGLNDVNFEFEDYIHSLKTIFSQCRVREIDCIFMSPNMLNTYVADDTPAKFREYAFETAEMQNSGKMDKYIYAAMDLAREMGVPVCDCYSKWKELAKTEDTTMLLCNRINHPTPEMHELFANALYDMIMA
jgi:lysophospholipase L1-like esterase